jgi:hypothetical protein
MRLSRERKSSGPQFEIVDFRDYVQINLMDFLSPLKDDLTIANPACVLIGENSEELNLQCRRRLKLDRTDSEQIQYACF